MRQVKLFKGLESDVRGIEAEINEWIRQSGAQVVSITGNIAPQSGRAGPASEGLGKSPFAPSDVLVIVLYEGA